MDHLYAALVFLTGVVIVAMILKIIYLIFYAIYLGILLFIDSRKFKK